MKTMIKDFTSEGDPVQQDMRHKNTFITRLLHTMMQYAVFAVVGMLTVLAVLWKQSQPADVSVVRNILVSVIADVLLVPAFIIVMALCKAVIMWLSDHWRYDTFDQRLASHRRLQNDFVLSALTGFATWLTFLTLGGERHIHRPRPSSH